jgi:hypothetical protein
MVPSFSTATLNVADIFHPQRRLWVQVHDKGGKFGGCSNLGA